MDGGIARAVRQALVLLTSGFTSSRASVLPPLSLAVQDSARRSCAPRNNTSHRRFDKQGSCKVLVTRWGQAALLRSSQPMTRVATRGGATYNRLNHFSPERVDWWVRQVKVRARHISASFVLVSIPSRRCIFVRPSFPWSPAPPRAPRSTATVRRSLQGTRALLSLRHSVIRMPYIRSVRNGRTCSRFHLCTWHMCSCDQLASGPSSRSLCSPYSDTFQPHAR